MTEATNIAGLTLARKLLNDDRAAFVQCHIVPEAGLSAGDRAIADDYTAAIAAITGAAAELRTEHAQRVTAERDELVRQNAELAARLAEIEAQEPARELPDSITAAIADFRDACIACAISECSDHDRDPDYTSADRAEECLRDELAARLPACRPPSCAPVAHPAAAGGGVSGVAGCGRLACVGGEVMTDTTNTNTTKAAALAVRNAAAALARRRPLYDGASGEPADEDLAQAIEDLPLPDVDVTDWRAEAERLRGLLRHEQQERHAVLDRLDAAILARCAATSNPRATRPTAHCLPPWRRKGSEMGDLMSATEVLARLRIDAASEDFEGAQLGPVAVRKLLKHVAALESDRWRQLCRIHSNRADTLRRERDELAARLEAIERAEPVAWMHADRRMAGGWAPRSARAENFVGWSPLIYIPGVAQQPPAAEARENRP